MSSATTFDLLFTADGALSTEALALSVVATVLSIIIATFFLSNRTPTVLPLDDFQEFPLIEKIEVSHDTRKFTFALPTPKHKLNLPIGQHMTLKFTDAKDGKNHQRSYTPITGNETLGKVTFCIKVYRAGVNPKFPEGGKLSQHLDSLKIGDTMLMKGPKGHMDWLGTADGKFTLKLSPRKPLETRSATKIGMIAGGTGITPMLQVLNAIFKHPKVDNDIEVSLLYANQTVDDILVREELESLAKEYPSRFKLHYTIDKDPPTGWKGSVGFVSKEMIQKHLPSKQSDGTTQIFMCGPPPMIKFACLPNLQELGFNENEWFSF